MSDKKVKRSRIRRVPAPPRLYVVEYAQTLDKHTAAGWNAFRNKAEALARVRELRAAPGELHYAIVLPYEQVDEAARALADSAWRKMAEARCGI